MRTGRPLTYTPQQIQQVRTLAAQGVRVPEIGKALGRNAGGIWCLMKRLGIPRQPHWNFPHGEQNPGWKDGRYRVPEPSPGRTRNERGAPALDADGYVLIYKPDHPHTTKSGHVREHRLVMEAMLGRYLLPGEGVHHHDKNKQNNDPSNLRLFASNADHLRHELAGRVPRWTEDGLRRIRDGLKNQKHGPHSQESKLKMSISQRARQRQPHSPETRERMRQAALRRGALKRAASQNQ